MIVAAQRLCDVVDSRHRLVFACRAKLLVGSPIGRKAFGQEETKGLVGVSATIPSRPIVQ